MFFYLLMLSSSVYAQFVPNTTWEYSSDTDKMTSEINYYASTYSDGKEYPPSTAKYPARLLIENAGGTNLFALIILKGGEIEREHPDSTTVLLRFDDEKPEVYAFAFQSKTNSTAIYRDYNSATGLIEKLRKSKYLRIKFSLKNDEDAALGFDVSTFKWSHQQTKSRPTIIH